MKRNNVNTSQNAVEKERFRLLKQIEEWLEFPIMFLGMLWLALLIIEFISGLNSLLEGVMYFIWGVFILEFLIRFILAPAKITFIKKNIITIVALIVPALRVFRIFQALRILRIARAARGIRLFRILSSLNRGFKALRNVFGRKGFGYVITFTVIVTFAGAAGMYALEAGNDGFKSYGDSLWWTAMMMTTSGSASWPVSPEGRILAFLLALYAFTIFGYVAATLATFFIEQEANHSDSKLANNYQINKLIKEVQSLKKEIQSINKKK